MDDLYKVDSTIDKIGDVLTTTSNNIRQKMPQDNIYDKSAMLNWIKKNCYVVIDGGAHIVEPIKYDKNDTLAFINPEDTVDTAPTPTLSDAIYDGKVMTGSITMSNVDMTKNSGNAKIYSLLKSREDDFDDAAAELLSQALFASAPASTDPDSLLTIINTTGTVGRIPRADNSFWEAQVETGVGSVASNGIGVFTGFHRSNISKNSGAVDRSEIACTTSAVFNYIEKAMQGYVQIADKDMANVGFRNISLGGIPLIYDSFCPAGMMFWLNSKYFKMTAYSGMNMQESPFVKPYNQLIRTKQKSLLFNFTSNNCRRLGAQKGITA